MESKLFNLSLSLKVIVGISIVLWSFIALFAYHRGQCVNFPKPQIPARPAALEAIHVQILSMSIVVPCAVGVDKPSLTT